MFNYWTEGGFIAWGQEPDPDTGRTPLQLFMDGRAQAAYNYDMYMRWSDIMFGGELVQKARMRNQSLTAEDYMQIGEWLNKQLKRYNVWVVLMPSNQFDQPFVRALEHNKDWRLAYLDDKQKLYVDVSTPRGQEIFNGIEDGSTKFPSESYRNIIRAHNALVFPIGPEQITKGLDCLIKSMEESPSRVASQMLEIYYDRYPQLRPRIVEFWKKILDDFTANEKRYLSSNGFYDRLAIALMAIGHLQPIAQAENNTNQVQSYEQKKAELVKVVETIRDRRW
jgi:hypothetical protein